MYATVNNTHAACDGLRDPGTSRMCSLYYKQLFLWLFDFAHIIPVKSLVACCFIYLTGKITYAR